ncbi:MAG: DUF302 domain-containing protein [Campylobacterota bacterium]|nr:DUF302 domain-containing protein [Campylobacterota bacterium]
MKKTVLTFLAGAIVMAFGIVTMMPSMMIVEHESKYSTVDETTNALADSIKANGWSVAGKIRNMNKTIQKHGLDFSREVRIIELCKAEYAKDMIATNPEISTMMPCAWGVYEKNGKILISAMNMGLMGKIFGGNIAKVVGKSVAADEHNILKAVIK